MHWAMTHDPGEQPAETHAWIAKSRLTENLRSRVMGNANGSDTRSVSGSGSQLWEDNFHKLYGELMNVVQRFPGLSNEITAAGAEFPEPETGR